MANIEDDPDLSGFTSRFADIRRERDLLRSQNHDLEVNLKVAESKVERLTEELERAKAQLDGLKSRIVEKETIIQNIGATLVAHIKKEQIDLGVQPGVPYRSGNSQRAISEGLRSVERSLAVLGGKDEGRVDDNSPIGGNN